MKKGEKNVKPIVNYEYYNNIFNTQYNFRFGRPRIDACAVCGVLKKNIDDEIDNEKKNALILKKKLHISKADIFYLDLDDKSKTACNDPSVEVVCFDYQQNLPLPLVPEGYVFYSRQL